MNSSTKQTRPPGSAQKNSPCTHKENHEEVGASPLDKRQKIGRDIFGAGKAMASPKIRARQAFSEVHNMGQEPAVDVATNNGNHTDAIGEELTKEDVEALLNMKMKGKTKFDYKGKTEQMTDYIKKLRACIRWLQELEESSTLQKQHVQNQLLNERNEHKQTEDAFKEREQELQLTIVDLNKTCSSLEDRLQKAEAEKQAIIEDKKREIEAREEAEKKQRQLSEELVKAQKEASGANQQVASLQDINKRLQEYNASLQQYNGKLQSDAASAAETISKVQKEKSTMMETLSTLRGHSAAVQEQLATVRASHQECANQKKALMEENDHLRGDLQRAIDERDQQIALVQTLTVEVGKYKECTGKTAAELEQLATKTTVLEESFSSQSEHVRNLCIKLEVANHKLQIQESSVLQQREVYAEQKQKIEVLQRRLEEAELQIFEGELVRRKLHNTILELKGNIRVFCRVRPIMPEDECTGSDSLVVQYPASAELIGRGIDLIQSPGQKHPFIFDKVFGPEAGQEEVFVEISQLVQSALDGYKVCIFAYGQTGSGKTHTMIGRTDVENQKGVIPRSLEQIFKTSQSLASQGWSFRMQASMLEIYNETIRDLLVSNKPSNADGTRIENGTKQYTIKHDQNGNTNVSDLTIVDVTSSKEVSSLLHRAFQSRSVGKTAMNEQSSRSHCVFTLRISGVNESTEQQVHGVLNLIDLAGSERLSRSGSTGERLKETQSINKSLSCLGDVILAIANREQHIPYRNSKLTYLLQPCLGGDSKTLMFVNISPDPKSLNESLCSLRFAAKVNSCDIGVPRRQTHPRTADSRLSYN
ncbi:hypothetical protein SUGI_0792160 [Cryptomeria japonica]|uniref:kinesin-like protein KIN-14N n=1 Tax=Cryptomeria japonica TaxID=3369 RepID=UPI0024147156|nr:kinesin-like protein KIN-14N [Cryptomeria japonica]GLJ38863.1 hypothetical protein SUGI_0792160 [Cryptomeria japonica]